MIKLVAIVQCHLVHERCPGYFCDKSFVERTGGFEGLEMTPEVRKLSFTCGGCCGRALHRKLVHLKKKAKSADSIAPEEILVKLASCITTDNYHGPACPHLDYLETIVQKAGLTSSRHTNLSKTAEKRREAGIYAPR